MTASKEPDQMLPQLIESIFIESILDVTGIVNLKRCVPRLKVRFSAHHTTKPTPNCPCAACLECNPALSKESSYYWPAKKGKKKVLPVWNKVQDIHSQQQTDAWSKKGHQDVLDIIPVDSKSRALAATTYC